MANTLTGLIPDIYEALDVVSREQVGAMMAVSNENSVERAAQGQEVRIMVSNAESSTDIEPGVTPPDDGDTTTGYVPMLLTHAKRVPVRMNGKEVKGLNHGAGASNWRAARFAQGFRHLSNLIEASIVSNYKYASRAVGTAGTVPFAADIGDSAQALKVMIDNGAPRNALRMVLNTSASTRLRTLGHLTKANEAGTDSTLRTGSLLDLNGWRIGETGAFEGLAHIKGTGAGYLVNSATLVRGDTDIPVDTGAGTIVAGDVVTFAGDPNNYMVQEDMAAGVLKIAKPGLLQAPADDAAITVGDSYAANLAFDRHAIQLATRAPELPEEGDMAADRQLVTDPFSGMTYEIALYPQYRQIQYEISIVWGSKVIKPEHFAVLMG